MMLIQILGARGSSHLVPGLSEWRGILEVVPLDATPAGSEVRDGLTRLDILVVQDVAMVIQNTTAGQLVGLPAGSRPYHLAVQRHHRGDADGQAWRTPPTGGRTGLGAKAAVHLPGVGRGEGSRVG